MLCPKDILRSLYEVGSALVGILYNYHAMLRYHRDEDNRNLQTAINEQQESSDYEHGQQQNSDQFSTISDNQLLGLLINKFTNCGQCFCFFLIVIQF